MTEPGVSPTAIEVAARALNPNTLSGELVVDSQATATCVAEAVIRALVDSGELATREQYETAVVSNRLLRRELNMADTEHTRLAAEVLHAVVELAQARDEYTAMSGHLRADRDRLAAEGTRLEAATKTTITWPADAIEANELQRSYWTAIKERMERAEAEVERLSQREQRLLEAGRKIDGEWERYTLAHLAMDGPKCVAIMCEIEAARAVLGEFTQEGERP